MFWATFQCRQNGRQNLPDRPPIGMILDTPTEFSRGAPNRSSGGPVGAPNRSSGGPIGTSGARIWRSYRVCHFSIFIFLRAQGYSRLILRNSAVCQIETRTSGMVWGPRSMGCALNFRVCHFPKFRCFEGSSVSQTRKTSTPEYVRFKGELLGCLGG